MKKNIKSQVKHFYAQAYADYLRSGNLEGATREVAQQIFLDRKDKPGNAHGDWIAAERITREWPRTITEASESHLYDKTMAKTREWLKDIETELGFDNPNDAYRAFRAVLHAIRDRLPVRESTQFASQLPMLMIGMYYSGWTPVNKPVRVRSMDEFLDRVQEQLPKGMDPMRVAAGIIRVLERHISEGEMKDVRRNFPEKLREVWKEALEGRR
ncbi:MAG: hypothetical protein COX65_07075 [Elusimicrobia bacterium CG_4_10_14_0_2_um_filter_56_8]|nr:MAG: hypothetical protein COX65_07075 [Elusimicrobia bacterium CG_4_10_14_0_2_um_filter_56_8]